MNRALAALAMAIAAALAAVATAAEPLDLELPTLDGARFFKLSQVRGRAVVLNFWDDECPPCVREMPMLERASKSRHDVLFVGVTVAERRRAQEFLESHAVSYLQLAGPPEPRGLLRRFANRAGALPHTAVLRPDHTLCAVRTGEIDAAWLDAALSRCAA